MAWQDGKTMYDFYVKYWVPFGELLTDMERNGIKVSAREMLPEAERRAKEDSRALEFTFREWAASYVPEAWFMNPSSGTQIQTLFFGGTKNQAQTLERSFSDVSTSIFAIESSLE